VNKPCWRFCPLRRVGRPVAEAVLQERVEAARPERVGHRPQNVADLVGELLHQPVLVRIVLAENVDAMLLHKCIELLSLSRQ